MQELQSTDQAADLSPAVDRIEQLEREMLGMEQVECPVNHYFGPGVCLRVLSMQAGTKAIGHRQKFDHLNILMRGAVEMLNEDGSTTVLRAPLIFVGKPGRKVGQVLEDMVWINAYATDLRDVESIEAHFIEKSAAWMDLELKRWTLLTQGREAERLEFAERFGAEPPGQVTALPECREDGNALIRPSPIHGHGMFVGASVEPWHVIAPVVVSGARTLAGQFLNHSSRPNAVLVRGAAGQIDVVATARINGPKGGQQGDEVVIDYEQAASLYSETLKELP